MLMQNQQFQSFLELHQLPFAYLEQAFCAFQPVINDVLSLRPTKQPIVLGINGCQGSGKTTTAAFLQHAFEAIYHLNVVNISLDDFYLSKAARINKAQTVHPLFATRGVPGTHDTNLALSTIKELLDRKAPFIPRFNKATDDLFPQNKWNQASDHIDIIILEGWFLCARAQDDSELINPVNSLERDKDLEGIWRRLVNQYLKTDYQELFNLVDCLVMLKAPSFEAVFKWRLEQETKLAKKLQSSTEPSADSSGLMSKEEIRHFINYFQRLTEVMLIEMPERADHCYFLNSERQIIHERHRGDRN
tara:strand:- start:4122 stop:5033 length:912 start_codon:yes stop_codon:yes gene_type:complete